MSRIVISLASGGREHSFRALAIVELLADHHDLLLVVPETVDGEVLRLCSGYARVEIFKVREYGWRAKAFKGDSPRASTFRTAPQSYLRFLEALGLVQNRVQRFSPDLLIAGFEPILPRVGRRLNIKTICVDYQHLLDDLDLRALPLISRLPLAAVRFASRLFCPVVDQHIISSFHTYPVRSRHGYRSHASYQRISVLVRKELQFRGTSERHLLVKMNSQLNDSWLDQLIRSKLPARIYGHNRSDKLRHLTFRNSTETFADDLLSCAGVVTDASNQLIGEALACGKPVLAIPSQTDYHKKISALFLSRSGLAGTMTAPVLTSDSARAFYESLSRQAPNTIPVANEELLSIIDSHLTV